MKQNSFLICYFFCTFTLQGQITLFPEIKRQDEMNLLIKKIEITDQLTIVDFYYRADYEAWICAEKSFNINPEGTDSRLYMIVAKNITVCPKMQKVGSFNDHHNFQIWFPYLQKDYRKINIIEKARDGFNFYGVKINNGQTRPVPDSSGFKTKEAFEDYLRNNSGALDPIEGIWTVHIISSAYQQGALLEKIFSDTLYKVAILKKGDIFQIYNPDGSPVESVFKWINGGERYYFTRYFREVDKEVSEYVKTESLDFFEIFMTIPSRLARYMLIEDFFLGDEVRQHMSFKKEMPLPGY
jgi:hypothetical protein